MKLRNKDALKDQGDQKDQQNNIMCTLNELQKEMNTKFAEIKKTQEANTKALRELEESVYEIVKFFNHMTWLKKTKMWVLGFIATIGAAIAAVKTGLNRK